MEVHLGVEDVVDRACEPAHCSEVGGFDRAHCENAGVIDEVEVVLGHEVFEAIVGEGAIADAEDEWVAHHRFALRC